MKSSSFNKLKIRLVKFPYNRANLEVNYMISNDCFFGGINRISKTKNTSLREGDSNPRASSPMKG